MKRVVYQCEGDESHVTGDLNRDGWFEFTVTDRWAVTRLVHFCPACWPSATFAQVIKE